MPETRFTTKSTLRLVVSEIAAIAINLVPFVLWFFDDYSSETTMIIYFFECVAGIIFAAIFVLILAPGKDPGDSPTDRGKGGLLKDFLATAAVMLTACVIFLWAFLFLVLKVKIDLSLVGYALIFIIAFQFAEFLSNLLVLRPLSLKKAEFFLSDNLGHTALLFLGVFLGILCAAILNEWFIVPFIILKTIADMGGPIQHFLGKKGAGSPLKPLKMGKV